MISQEVIFEWTGEFETERKLEVVANKHGGCDTASGLGPSGREKIFEYPNMDQAERAAKEMGKILSGREHSIDYLSS